jgi:hypothetical protein
MMYPQAETPVFPIRASASPESAYRDQLYACATQERALSAKLHKLGNPAAQALQELSAEFQRAILTCVESLGATPT